MEDSRENSAIATDACWVCFKTKKKNLYERLHRLIDSVICHSACGPDNDDDEDDGEEED